MKKFNDFFFKVSWNKRHDGYQPFDGWVQGKIIKKKSPEALFEFYESNVIINGTEIK